MASYQEFIKLTVMHSFYETGKSRDLIFQPTVLTKKMLSRQRMLFKRFNEGIWVIAEVVGTNQTTIKIDETIDLYFGIKYEHAESFLGVTELDEASPSTVAFDKGCRIFLYNKGMSNTLKYKV